MLSSARAIVEAKNRLDLSAKILLLEIPLTVCTARIARGGVRHETRPHNPEHRATQP